MNFFNHKYSIASFWAVIVLLVLAGCARDLDELEPADFPTDGDVFIDGFSGGLKYAAFGGSDVTAFDTDTDTKYKGTTSMMFRVPDVGDPAGAYAGGTFYLDGGRDLSGYNVLTFWAKATKSASLDIVGFGNDLGENKYIASIKDVKVNTNWKQFFIPIPDASKLKMEKGMFFYSEGPEDGNGYTFWIDEVRFENLGTIGQSRAAIQGGEDQAITSETGAVITIDGTVTTNLANGTNQVVNAAPAYFSFESTDDAVASVNDLGQVMVMSEGEATITAKLGDDPAQGSLIVTSTGAPVLPATKAPTPMIPAENVISLYSDAYDDVPVDTWNPFWEFSTAMEQEVQVDGDFMRRYTTLNFVGIEFKTQRIDATAMTHFHIDIWTPEPTDAGQEFKVLLVDFGPDGAFGGEDDASHEITFTAPTLATESWVSLDIPLSDFAGLTQRANLAQLVLSGTVPTVFIDNVFFYDDGGMTGATAPETGAPAPTNEAADVISIFSDTYTNVEGTNFNPDWGQATSTSIVDIAGNNTLLMAGLNYQGVEFAEAIDVSGMTHLHLDYWTTSSSQLNAYLISDGPVEKAVALGVPTMGWGSIDIPLSQFDPVDLAAIIQMKFDGNGTIYMDNIYFHKDGGTGGGDMPTTAAPAPTHEAANVVSLFSDSYTSVDGLNLNPDWGQSTQVSEESIEGNNTLKYGTFNYQGTEFAQQDLSGMEFLHIDMWTADATDVKVTPISASSGEFLAGLTPINSGQWTSYDIPLSTFTDNGMTLADVIQIKLDGQAGNTPSNLWLDNIYFYKTGGTGGGDMPTTAAPAPTHDAANVVSLFSDSYTSVDGLNLNPDWGQSTQVSEELIEGNNTLKYGTFNYQGTEFTQQDLSGMEFLHIDMWTADATDVKVTPISSSGEFLTALAPINSGQWNSYDIPLSAFGDNGVNLSEIFQLKMDGQAGVTPSNLWLDNIYFYKEGGTSGEDNPTVSAPTPTIDADKVVSIFSDSYTNIDGVNFNPNWGQSTVVSEEMIAGNNTLKYATFNYQGTEFAAQDLSGMKYLHIDMWTADATNVQITPISSTGEFLTALDPINSGSWTSYDIPLTTFSDMGVTLSDIFQLKFDGQAGNTPSNIWLDNIFFYTDEDMGSGDDMPTTTAADPTVDASRVISVFSDAYTDIAGTDFNPNWGQSTVVTTADIMGNNVLSYADFNYQGTQLGFEQDLSNMEFLHIDMWTADATDVKVTPISASSGEYLTPLAPIMSGQWTSYDIPLSTFTDNGMTLADVIQIKFDGQAGNTPNNLWLDNIYFYRTTDLPMMPTEAAPTPTTDANRVVSIFSDVYNSVAGLDLNPNWGQSTQVSEQMIAGNNTLLYADFNYQGTQFDQVDLSNMAYLHVDMWTADATDVKVTPISSTGETLVSLMPITPGVWNSYDIPVSMFTDGGMTLADVFQMKFDGQGGVTPSNIYLDNIYFYEDGANGPAAAAPVPTFPAADVISIFSDSYTNVEGTDFNPNWGQVTQVSFEEIDGNNTMLYTGLNYQGIQLGTPVNATDMTTLQLDVWTNNSTTLRVFLISPGGVETPVDISVPTAGWSTVAIPLTDFMPVDMADIIQFKFDGNGDIYIDNLYFRK